MCFLGTVEGTGSIAAVRAVARGHGRAVLAAVRDADPGMIVLHNHPSGDLRPSDADLRVAADLHALELGLGIVDNEARELYVVVEPPRLRELTLLDEAAIRAALGPGGPVARAHAQYEDRPTQRAMAAAVACAYNDGGVTIAEAGTGTGKSVAYLIPAIAWSIANGERTIISTNTINLQEQLVGKDLPFLRRALGQPFRFTLVKGRHNYVSIRRARLAVQAQGALFETAEQRELDALMVWLNETREGSLQDLPFQPSGEIWDEVVSDSDVCLRTRCPHFETCFYQRARRDAAVADVLVVNHHLLFSDLAVRRAQGNFTASAVLPPYRRVILDEAHNLEDAATSHLGANVTRRGVLRVLRRLDRHGRGVLGGVEMRLLEGENDLLRQDALSHIAAVIRPRVERARDQAVDFFDHLEALMASADDGVIRLEEGFVASERWSDGAAASLEGLLLLLDELARAVARLREIIVVDKRWEAELEEQLVELQGVEGRLGEAGSALRTAFSTGPDPVPMVRWLERRGGYGGREPDIAARAAPIDLADALREGLFDRVDTAVLTSATLSTSDGFEFLRGRLGLTSGIRVTLGTYPSPFDFERQTVVALPTDLPEPQGREGVAFDRAIPGVAEDLARLCDGGLFVLFTSYRSLRAVAAELRRREADRRWPLFVQGEAPRARLLERFTRSGRGLLLGVASFWEGVDVPGEPLRGLVITRLPFKVPTEPLTAARIESIERNGGSGFRDYMLPHAALRLKQGFGRLIRSASDRGAVVILDRRVQARGYGRYFLDTLPPAPVHAGPWPELVETLRRFYDETALAINATRS